MAGSETAQAAPATGEGRYASSIYWLDWSEATGTGGSGIFRNRPFHKAINGTRVIEEPLPGFKLSTTFSKVLASPSGRAVHVTSQDPAWAEVKLNGYNTGDQYSVITPSTDASRVSFTLNFSATLNNVTVPVNVIATDGESAGSSEYTRFTTNGDAWQNIDNSTRAGAGMWKSNQANNAVGGFGTKTMGPWVTDKNAGAGTVPIGVSRNATTLDVTVDASGMQNVMIGVMLPMDFGDAPKSYGNASHLIDWTATGNKPMAPTGTTGAPSITMDWSKNPYLGLVPADADDGSLDGWRGDDTTPAGIEADEGWAQLTGADTPPRLLTGRKQDYNLEVRTGNADGKTVAAWIDWNANGTFETGERAEALAFAGRVILQWQEVTPKAGITAIGARFRVAANDTEIKSPMGIAASGEVEDHLLPVTQEASLEKSSDPKSGTPVAPGERVLYSLTLTNEGDEEALVDYTDHLSGVLDDADFDKSSVTADEGIAAEYDAGEQTLRLTGFIPAHSSATVKYAVTVKKTGFGDSSLNNVIVPRHETPPVNCDQQSRLCTEHPVAASLLLNKSSDPATGTMVAPGDTIKYTVTALNEGGPAKDVVLVDDLSDVLNNAVFAKGSAELSIAGSGTKAVADPEGTNEKTLKTAPFTLPAGGTATMSYSVTVNDDAWLATLRNTVTGSWGTTNTPAICDVCSTTHTTNTAVIIEKVGESSDATLVPMDGSAWVIRADNNGMPGDLLANPAIKPVTGEIGRFQLAGISPGMYWLEETQAPEGFNLLAEPVRFHVDKDGPVSLGQGAGEGIVTVAETQTPKIYMITVRDVPAMELPTSGGPGSTGYLVGGGILLAAASLMAWRSRRQQA